MKTSSRYIVLFLIAAFFASSLGGLDSAEARRRKRRRAKQPKVINEKKLFERLGGKSLLDSSVDEWFRLALLEPDPTKPSNTVTLAARLKPLAERPTNFAKLRRQVADELCEISDGPCPEREDSAWLQLRASAGLDESGMIQLTSILSDVLYQKGVAERERNELLGRIGGIEPLSSAEAAGPASERRGGNR